MPKKKKSIKQLADIQFGTISQSDRKSLGITKSNFRKDFARELKVVRRKKRR